MLDMVPAFLRRGIGRGVKNIIREKGWGTAFGSLFGILFLVQILILIVFGVEGGLRLLQEQSDLRLEILETASDEQIQDFFQSVRSLPYVQDVVYITREQAYERQKQRDPELVSFLTTFKITNPFPETMGIRLRKLSDYQTFTEFLRKPEFMKVVDPNFLSTTTDQEQQIHKLVEAVRAVEYLLFSTLAIALIAILLIIVEFVRHRALRKSEELFIQQLVGAGPLTALVPFWTEMVCLLCAAIALSVLCLALFLWLLPLLLPVIGTSGLFAPWSAIVVGFLWHAFPLLLFGEVLVALLLAALGTFLSLKTQMSMHLLRLQTP